MLKKKIIIMLISLFAILIPLTISVSAAVDYEENWAKETIAILMERGIISAVDLNGNIKPQIPITRAEVASAINKTYGYTQTTAINYKDADPSAWYYKDLQIARAAGYMIGDGTYVHPNDPISRQELSTVVGRILQLSSGKDYAKTFKDVANIADWSINYVGALAKEKVLLGYTDGTFLPKNNITRAEAYTVILRSEKIFRAIKNSARNTESVTVSTASSTVGNSQAVQNYMDVTVTAKSVTLENIIVNGDLIIAKDVADGNVTLKNVTVKGGIYIYGGGTSSVTATDCNFNYVILNSSYNTRFLLNGSGNNSVNTIIALSGGTIDVQTGTNSARPNIAAATGMPSNAVLNIKGSVNIVDVKCGSTVNIQGKAAMLNAVNATASNSKVNVASGASVNTANFGIPLNVSGDGTISTANVDSSGVVLSVPAQTVIKKPDVEGTPTIDATFQSLVVASTNSATNYIQLTATFDKGINDGLSASDISVKGASLVSVTGTGKTYTITISNVTAKSGEYVHVNVQKAGYTIKSATKSVNLSGNSISFMNLTANGSASSITTQLTITFDKSVTGLSVNDFAVTGATKSTLTGSGSTYYLTITDITVADRQNISVKVSKNNYIFTPDTKTVAVFKPSISFTNLTADGSDTASTAQLTITLDKNVPGLSISDFTVTGATKGTLTQSTSSSYSNIYYLTVSTITVSDYSYISVKIAKTNYVFSPDTLSVQVRKLPDISFSNLTADGSSTAMTTKLTVYFNTAVSGLTISDFTVEGATKGSYVTAGSSNYSYEIPLTSINVTSGEKVKVTISKSGYNFTPNNKEVIVYKPATTAVYGNSINAENYSSSTTTTRLVIILDKQVSGLSASDFTVNGASKGTLSSGSVTSTSATYYLPISSITVGDTNSINVTLSKTGYTFSPNSQNVPVRVADTFTFNSVSANGNSTTTATTTLTLNLSKSLPNTNSLSLADITVKRPDNSIISATNLQLTQSGSPGRYTIDITPVASETLTVTISKNGYTITTPSQTVPVYKPAQNVTISSIAANGDVNTTTSTLTITLSQNVGSSIAVAINPSSVATGDGTATATSSGSTTYTMSLTVISTGQITATVTLPSGYSISGDSSKVANVFKYTAPVLVQSISVTSNTTGNNVNLAGATSAQVTLTAAVTPTTAANTTVTWSIVNGGDIATVGQSNGILTITGTGTITIKATATDGSGVFGEITITVTDTPAPDNP